MATQPNKMPVTVNESDQALYYEALNYIPVENKDLIWAAKCIYFAKTHSRPLVDPAVAFEIRKKMSGELDVAKHKKMIDPTLGIAEFFHSDYKACPIDSHLDEIVEATIKQIPVDLAVKAVDEYSVANKEANNKKIQNRKLLISVINQVNGSLGFPLLKPSDDPYKYIEQMQSTVAAGSQPGAPKPPIKAQGGGKVRGIPTDIMESILSQIDSSELLGIYNTFLHKEGVEIACELGINYYLNVKNKWVFNHASNVLADIKMFNKCAVRMYTSQTTGTPVIQYYRPEHVQISPYSKRDLSDHIHWIYEDEVTFADFERMFGAELTRTQLLDIFELNRKYNHVLAYEQCDTFTQSNAKIRLGYQEWLSQDMEVYAEYSIMGNNRYKKMASDFVPGMKKDRAGKPVKDANIQNSARDEAHYNVWYKCYFIPYYMYSNQTATQDYKMQAKYIYQFGKLQDQERYGDDECFSRSSLIGFYSDRLTWFEIKDRIKTKIDHLWLLFQNDIANIMPHGLNWVHETIVDMAKTVDEANKSNKNAASVWARKLKETGSAITKRLKDKDGNPIADQMPFTPIKTGHLEAALGKLDAIMVLYDLMVKSLGQNELSEGGAPKPRTNLGSIQLALGTSGKSTFYVEEAYTDVLASIGNKMLKYFSDIVEYGDSKRLQEFENVVGQVNMAALKEIKGIPLRDLGIYVENTMTKDQKEMVMQLAQSMASAGTLDIETALFLTFVDNLRQAYAILVFKKAQMDKQLAQAKQNDNDFQMQLLDKQKEIELAKIQASGEVKAMLEKLLGNVQMQLETMVINLKGHWTTAGKEQIKNNRIEQDITNSQINKLNAPAGQELPEHMDMPVAS